MQSDRLDGGTATNFQLQVQQFGPEAAVSIDWDFGDGRTASGVATQVRYTTPGVYPVVVAAQFPTAGRVEARLDLTVLDPTGGATLAGTEVPMPPLLGDVDGDLALTNLDVSLLTAHVQGQSALTPEAMRAGDIRFDGRLDEGDVEVLTAVVANNGLLPEALDPIGGPRGTMCRLVSQDLRDVNARCEVQVGTAQRQLVRRLYPGYGLFVVPLDAVGPATAAPITPGPVPVVLYVDGVAVQTHSFDLTNPPPAVGDEIAQLRDSAPELFQQAATLRVRLQAPETMFGTSANDRAVLAAMLDFAADQFATATTAIDAFTDAMTPAQRDGLAYLCRVAGVSEARARLSELNLPSSAAALQIGGGNARVDLILGVSALVELADAIQEVVQSACYIAAGGAALTGLFVGPVALVVGSNILAACNAMETSSFVVEVIEALLPELADELDMQATPLGGLGANAFGITVCVPIANGHICGSALDLAAIVQSKVVERLTRRLTVLGSYELVRNIPFSQLNGALREAIVNHMRAFLEGLGTAFQYLLNATGLSQWLNDLKAQVCGAVGSESSIPIAWGELERMDVTPNGQGWALVPPTGGGASASVQWTGVGVGICEVHATLPTVRLPLFGSVLVFAGAPPNMVPIAPGTFQMGSTAYQSQSPQEAPVHEVTLSYPFWMGKYEVTQAEYQAVVGSNPSYFQGASAPNAPQRPVERVSWNSAVAYCQALTASEQAAGRVPAGYQYRLPTEAEWEYCCRAGTTTEWNTGTSLSTSQANFAVSLNQTTVVGSYAPNAFGLHDMHGNVWEVCLDSYASYAPGPVTDPFVTGGAYRVIRGGGWASDITAIYCRSAYRYDITPGLSGYSDIGFRVVLAPVLVP